MNWKVYLEDNNGNVCKGVAHYVHEDAYGIEVRLLHSRDAMCTKHADIKKFTKKRLRK